MAALNVAQAVKAYKDLPWLLSSLEEVLHTKVAHTARPVYTPQRTSNIVQGHRRGSYSPRGIS